MDSSRARPTSLYIQISYYHLHHLNLIVQICKISIDNQYQPRFANPFLFFKTDKHFIQVSKPHLSTLFTIVIISYGPYDMKHTWWRTVLCFFEPEAVFGSLSFSSISLEKSVIAATNWSRKHISNVIFITQVSKKFKRSEMKDFKYFKRLMSLYNNKIHMEREYYRLKCYCPNRFPI